MYCWGTYLFISYQYFQIHCNDVLVNLIGLFCFLTDHVGPPTKRSQCLIPNSYDWRFNAHQRQSISYNKINHKQCNFFINNSYSIGISTYFWNEFGAAEWCTLCTYLSKKGFSHQSMAVGGLICQLNVVLTRLQNGEKNWEKILPWIISECRMVLRFKVKFHWNIW